MTTPSVTQPKIVQQFFNESHFEGTVEELLTALEGPQKSPLSVKQQADIYVLLWVLDGFLKMLRERVDSGSGLRIYKLADSVLLDLFGAIPLTDKGKVAANKMIDAMPASSARKQALDFKAAKHAEYWRKREEFWRKQGYVK